MGDADNSPRIATALPPLIPSCASPCHCAALPRLPSIRPSMDVHSAVAAASPLRWRCSRCGCTPTTQHQRFGRSARIQCSTVAFLRPAAATAPLRASRMLVEEIRVAPLHRQRGGGQQCTGGPSRYCARVQGEARSRTHAGTTTAGRSDGRERRGRGRAGVDARWPVTVTAASGAVVAGERGRFLLSEWVSLSDGCLSRFGGRAGVRQRLRVSHRADQ